MNIFFGGGGGGGGGETEPLWGRGTHPAGLYADKSLYVHGTVHDTLLQCYVDTTEPPSFSMYLHEI